TDAHDADQRSVAYDRQVPDTVLGHRGTQVFDLVTGCARAYGLRHDRGDRRIEQRGTPLVETAHDVTFGHDALDRRPVGGDDDSTDIALGEQREQDTYLGVRLDGRDLIALAAKDLRDSHEGPPDSQ